VHVKDCKIQQQGCKIYLQTKENDLLDVISLSEHDVVTICAIDVQINLSNVRRPVVCTSFHLLRYIQYTDTWCSSRSSSSNSSR